jgi:hypothetical protein
MAKVTIAEKLRWNANQLLETNTYIRMFTAGLEMYLSPSSCQTVFMISKFFTDGTISLTHANLLTAKYYFERGEKYFQQIPKSEVIQLNFIANIYGRSKSFHYYKLNEIDQALKLTHDTIRKTKELESNPKLEFLVLDRISLYNNMARIYFSLHEEKKAFAILSDCISFLMSWKAGFLTDLNDHYVTDFEPNLVEMKSMLLQQLFTDTILILQKEVDRQVFLNDSYPFVTPLFSVKSQFLIQSQMDKAFSELLEIIEPIYTNHDFNNPQKQLINYMQKKFDQKALINVAKGFLTYCR